MKKKPARTASLHERSGKKPGGQQGHPGKTLRQTENPDETVDHFPETCAGCGGALAGATPAGDTARQVFDQGARATDAAKIIGIGRTTLYDALQREAA